jgi:hypothetical protein
MPSFFRTVSAPVLNDEAEVKSVTVQRPDIGNVHLHSGPLMGCTVTEAPQRSGFSSIGTGAAQAHEKTPHPTMRGFPA